MFATKGQVTSAVKLRFITYIHVPDWGVYGVIEYGYSVRSSPAERLILSFITWSHLDDFGTTDGMRMYVHTNTHGAL